MQIRKRHGAALEIVGPVRRVGDFVRLGLLCLEFDDDFVDATADLAQRVEVRKARIVLARLAIGLYQGRFVVVDAAAVDFVADRDGQVVEQRDSAWVSSSRTAWSVCRYDAL